ncbi:hypothetical protein [Lysinibacillus sp. NPDC056232]|uniref:hypothetical protein n=1 Tax=Lysinibacillus sp. NPDC056232 TaxID=3345756 RepID=UPI0035D878AF
MGNSNRGTKAKSITSCDNAFVTNIVLVRRPQEALLCAKAKRQQLFYLCESVATATTKRPVGTEINPRYGYGQKNTANIHYRKNVAI